MPTKFRSQSAAITFVTVVTSFLALGGLVISSGLVPLFVRDNGSPHQSESRATPPWMKDVAARNVPGAEMPYELRIIIAADEEYIESAGDEWQSAARATVLTASNLLSQIGVQVEIVGVRSWLSSDSGPGLAALLNDALEQVGPPSDAILVVLTNQEIHEQPDYDGWASSQVPATILKSMEPGRPTFASLVAHEVGHLLGAGHHDDDHECTDGGCVLDPRGYAHGYRWCDDHRDTISEILNTI